MIGAPQTIKLDPTFAPSVGVRFTKPKDVKKRHITLSVVLPLAPDLLRQGLAPHATR